MEGDKWIEYKITISASTVELFIKSENQSTRILACLDQDPMAWIHFTGTSYLYVGINRNLAQNVCQKLLCTNA